MRNEIFKRVLSSFIILPIALFFIIKGSSFYLFFLSMFFLLTSYEWHQMTKKKKYSIFGFVFLLLSYFSAYLIRGNTFDELVVFLAIILICISTDIGGYVFGNLFKGPKLVKISPNKTYAGVFGSYLLSIIFVSIFKIFYSLLNNLNDMEFLLLILSISTVSQSGDLIISYFKRLSKIRNTGKILPGHGGLLDRVDGMIFAIPFSYLLFKFMN
ncbi:MAG: phosphatidate cytidylyltransferase [Pelagibacterales bacterium]|nr:phosphatidate cytidylyltransferase [Pelagibacterales bacterium]